MRELNRETDWRRRIGELKTRLGVDVEFVSDLLPVAERKAEIQLLLADLEQQVERVRHAAVVTLVGATGAGKSALLNALAGQTIAEEGVDRPTTSQVTLYAPSDADLSGLLGGRADCDEAAADPNLRGVNVVRYEPTAGPWTAEVLVDTPDVNSIAEEHRLAVEALAERSDILIVVLHRQSVVEESPVSFLDQVARRRALIFVLNRADELTEATRDALLGQIRDLAASRWGVPGAPVLTLSARLAQSQPTAEWLEFRRLLMRMVREGALAGVRRHNALGTVGEFEKLFEEVVVETAPDLAALPVDVSAGLSLLVQRTADEVSSRLRVRQIELCHLLWRETADRWDGPGGWALRVGGLSTLGMGAGALIARRNPLLAAGAAVGGLAAQQVRQASERRRATAVSDLLPAESDFAAWYAEALSPTRVRAARLSGTPGAFGVPDAESVQAVAAGAVEDAWRKLVERDLPAAAERSLLRFFRLALDLPVYAIAAWVVYQVATGFFVEKYVGVDFLVNALLLVGTYLFAVRFVVRRVLSWRARKLLKEVIRRCREGLAGHFDQVRGGVASHTARCGETLQRLATLRSKWRTRLQEP